jgi:sialic acid synthase SpsE
VLGAVALGARVFEKHFTDDNDREGPDHKFAMNPVAWREMVDRANETYLALGDGLKRVEANEQESVGLQRRAIRAKHDLKNGSTITAQDIEFLRPIPENGLPPYQAGRLINKLLNKDIQSGECIIINDVNL